MSNKSLRGIRRGALFILAVVVAGVCLAAIERLRNATEEYSVYSAYLSTEILADNRDGHAETPIEIVVVDTTEMSEFSRSWVRNVAKNELGFGSLHISTRLSFIVRNSYHTRIFPKFTVPKPASVVAASETELRPLWDSSALVRNFGYLTLSGVGFNPSRTQAIFYVEHHCGGLCGGGWYVLMEKVGGAWQVRDKHNTWIS